MVKKKNNTIWWVIAVLVLVVGGLGIATYRGNEGKFLLKDLETNQQIYNPSFRYGSITNPEIIAETTNCRVYIEKSINANLINIRIMYLKTNSDKLIEDTTLQNPNYISSDYCLFQSGGAISF